MALLTTEDVLNKKFQSVKFREGYDQVEVDEFLDEVVATIYALQVENQELKEKLEAAERRISELSSGAVEAAPAPQMIEPAPAPEPAPVPEPQPSPEEGASESAASMLVLAQRVHDEYVRDGEEKADQIIADARAKGDEIIADADKHKQEILDKLTRERGLLENKVNELRSFEFEYRASIREHLTGLLAQVNQENN